MLFIITSTGNELLRNVNIDDLEPLKIQGFSEFFAILAFHKSKSSRPSRFKEACVHGCQRGVPF